VLQALPVRWAAKNTSYLFCNKIRIFYGANLNLLNVITPTTWLILHHRQCLYLGRVCLPLGFWNVSVPVRHCWLLVVVCCLCPVVCWLWNCNSLVYSDWLMVHGRSIRDVFFVSLICFCHLLLSRSVHTMIVFMRECNWEDVQAMVCHAVCNNVHIVFVVINTLARFTLKWCEMWISFGLRH